MTDPRSISRQDATPAFLAAIDQQQAGARGFLQDIVHVRNHHLEFCHGQPGEAFCQSPEESEAYDTLNPMQMLMVLMTAVDFLARREFPELVPCTTDEDEPDVFGEFAPGADGD